MSGAIEPSDSPYPEGAADGGAAAAEKPTKKKGKKKKKKQAEAEGTADA